MKYTLLLLAAIAWHISAAQTNVTIRINASQGLKPISPYIYGKNNNISDDPNNPTTEAQWQYMRDAGLRFTRENGGNNATKYNWRLKLSSHPDWYNNVYAHDWDYAAQTLQSNMPGVQGMWAFQLIGQVASNTSNNFNDYGYNQSQWWSGTCQNLAGGGVVNTSGGCAAKTNGDTALYLTAWPADSTTEILNHWFGSGGLGYDKSNILYWSMDNEPEIWNGTHDDVMPAQLAAEAFMQRYFAVAKRARALYPGIKLCGPVPASEWQWYNWNNGKITVGSSSYNWLEYFIKRCAEEQTASGIRLLDVIDIHDYPGEKNDSDIVQHSRIFFDTTYNYPGANGVKTTSSNGWDNAITKEYIFGRCRQWLNQYMGPDNGVTFGVSEYGAVNNDANATAVSYASMLGTFADNGVAYFTPWYWAPGMWETLHLFSRYAKTTRVQSISDNEQYVSAYSSVNSSADSMTVILVNRSLTANKIVTVNISNFALANGSYNTLQLSQLPATETFVSHTNNALHAATVTVSANTFLISLPPLSTTAVILKGTLDTSTSTGPATGFRPLYPNPASNYITITLPAAQTNSSSVLFTIKNVLGQEIYREDTSLINQTGQVFVTKSFDISSYPNGIYFLRAGNAKPVKFVVQH